jgi:hypothetical protein
VSLRVCLDCTAAFAVGVPRCPHCGSERHAEQGSAAALGVYASTSFEEETMPKITRHGGASDRRDLPGETEGGEQPSAGSSGETSSGTPSIPPVTSGSGPRKRARKTGNRSGQGQTGTSTAGSAGGGLEAGTSATDSADGGGES